MFSSFTYVMLIITCEVSAVTSLNSTAGKCEPVLKTDTIGLISVSKGPLGMCTNLDKIDGFKECRGACQSSDTYNQEREEYEATCEWCRVTRYRLVQVSLTCEYDQKAEHSVVTADECSCRPCGDNTYPERPSSPLTVTNKRY